MLVFVQILALLTSWVTLGCVLYGLATWLRTLRENALDECVSHATNLMGACDRLVSVVEHFERKPNQLDDKMIGEAVDEMWEAWRDMSRARVVSERYRPKPEAFSADWTSDRLKELGLPKSSTERRGITDTMRPQYNLYVTQIGPGDIDIGSIWDLMPRIFGNRS